MVSNYLVTEEEAIFNNELNEIGKESFSENENKIEEEAIFNNQLNEIIESDFHEPTTYVLYFCVHVSISVVIFFILCMCLFIHL
ncbi:hypothetical protein [Chryseobacterium indoltheticum]|uniref:hypothetical protein n=1 Tax=Chryseobacterium indoltheticum TaxID=254 RepID=UPI003F49B034